MISKIKEWLDKQVYPLEMKVAKALHENGFHPLQSNYYRDPETEKNREIDVVGQVAYTYNDHNIIFQLIIECKNNLSKPWITFSSDTHSIGKKAFLTNRPASIIGSKYLKFISDNDLLPDSTFLKRPDTLAYNVTQAFDSDSDRVYTALMSVVNAIKFRKVKINSESRHTRNCEIYYPIIVLGGKLFDCYLDKDNECKIEEVGHKILLWKNNIEGFPNPLVEITTFDSFKLRLKGINQDILSLLSEKSNRFFDQSHWNFSAGSL